MKAHTVRIVGRTPAPQVTLADAKNHVRAKRFEGLRCPCCQQFVKVYRRPLSKAMALALIELYRAGGTKSFVHSPTVLGRNRGAEARLQYWGLVEPQPSQTGDGETRRGWWRVTRKGQQFLQNKLAVPSHALIYNAECLDLRGDPIKITTALRSPNFSLRALLNGDA